MTVGERAAPAADGQGSGPTPKDVAGWAQACVALAAAIVAIVAAVYSASQVAQAKQQNTVSEQQALVSLVSTIAQDPVTIDEENAVGSLATSNSALLGTDFTELTDSEEAVVLIHLLHGNGVTAIEYYETGIGLEAASESDKRAMQMFVLAAAEAPKDLDPRTLSNAWLAAALLEYHAGDSAKYHSDLSEAEKAFSQKLGASTEESNRNVAYLSLVDASLKAGAHCQAALAEMKAAKSLISGQPSKSDQELEKQIAACSGGHQPRRSKH